MRIKRGMCLAAIGLALAFGYTAGSPAQVQPGGATPSEKAGSPPTDGAVLYATYCVDCHGKEGRGAGRMAATLSAKVPDLTGLARRNGGVFPLERVEKLLTARTPEPVTHGGVVMPAWGLVFAGGGPGPESAQLRAHNVARYLETIQK